MNVTTRTRLKSVYCKPGNHRVLECCIVDLKVMRPICYACRIIERARKPDIAPEREGQHPKLPSPRFRVIPR